MSASERSTFQQCALASGLLTEEQIEEARAAVGWSEGDEPDSNAPLSDQQLADRLVEMGRLNAWQAKQLFDGRTKFTLGPYQIVDSIGQGGMGQVFKAEHGVLGRVVAIKVLPLSKTTPDAVANFTREIRALASLDHRRLVRALDAGHDGNVYYLVAEYVPGSDLRKLVRRDGRLSIEAAAAIIFQVAEGLTHAHEKGLVHRDIKPGNVLVTPEGEAKLSDLGLAGPLEGDAENDPRYGKIVGTADYLSPDQVKSPWEPTPAWDIYSLGCTLYYAVTGKVPFPGGSTADKVRAHCELRPLDPRRLNKQLSDEFVDVLADMMAKNPSERIQSAREVMARLTPWVGRPVPETKPQPGPSPPPKVATPPVIATPPAVARPPSTARPIPIPPHPGDKPGPGDARFDFPEMPKSPPNDEESPSVILPTSAAVPATDAKGSWDAETDAERATPPMSILRPLLLLVLAPLGLVAAVMLAWWLMHHPG